MQAVHGSRRPPYLGLRRGFDLAFADADLYNEECSGRNWQAVPPRVLI
jgi:hypothetical protein